MPKTSIFSGIQSSTTPYGRISIDGNGSSARITFRDKSTGQESSAILQVYELHQLKSLQVFKENPVESEVETLINTWYTIKKSNTIIKFATQGELAFSFTAEHVEDAFSKWNGSHVCNLDYFNEIQLVRLFTREQLEAVSGMDEYKIKLLAKRPDSLRMLLQHGVTLEQIGQLERPVFEKCLTSNVKLTQALRFVTMQQIMGLEHTPPAIPEKGAASSSSSLRYLGGSSSGSGGGFSYNSRGNVIEVTHTSSITTLTMAFGSLTEAGKADFSSIDFSTYVPEHLVHDWYHIRNSNTAASSASTTRTIYCPDLGYIINETQHHPSFPLQQFKEQWPHMLNEVLYYREKSFATFLKKNGITLDELRALPGMTQSKINTLFDYRWGLAPLLQTGIPFADLAKVEEKRLLDVLSNYSDAEAALEFTDVFELLGLGAAPPGYSPAFFKSGAAPQPRGFSCRQNNFCLTL